MLVLSARNSHSDAHNIGRNVVQYLFLENVCCASKRVTLMALKTVPIISILIAIEGGSVFRCNESANTSMLGGCGQPTREP